MMSKTSLAFVLQIYDELMCQFTFIDFNRPRGNAQKARRPEDVVMK